MRFSLGRWRSGHLLLSWVAYWAALAAVKLGPALLSIMHATQLPDGQGRISASFGHDLLKLTVMEKGATVWDAAAPLSTVSLWVAGPPLLIWLAWLIRRPRRGAAETPLSRDLSAADRPAAIGAGVSYPMGNGDTPRHGERVPDVVRPDGRDRR